MDTDGHRSETAELLRRLTRAAEQNCTLTLGTTELRALVETIEAGNATVERLRAAIVQTLDENKHLADGDNCALIRLKRAVSPIER